MRKPKREKMLEEKMRTVHKVCSHKKERQKKKKGWNKKSCINQVENLLERNSKTATVPQEPSKFDESLIESSNDSLSPAYDICEGEIELNSTRLANNTTTLQVVRTVSSLANCRQPLANKVLILAKN